MPENGIIQVSGSSLVQPDGSTVVLRGVGLGGWMNMENFITGYPGTESQQRKALRAALGEEGYRRFFDRFLDDFFTDADARFLADLGLNCVRIPFNYRHFEDDDRPFELKEEGFRLLDRAIDLCARHRIYTVLDLHALPGFQNQHWHSDNPTHWAQFWTHRHFQDRTVHLWEALAARYRDQPWVAGYNPINEPADPTAAAIGPFYRRLERAIRAVDAKHVLFLDGNRYSVDFHMFGDPMPNCVYTAHDYALPGFIDGGGYPGTTRGQYVDRAVVERTFLARTEYMRKTGTPIWIGEFGPVFTGDPDRDEQRYQLLTDQLALYAEHGAGWALWAYKDMGAEGVVSAAADSPWSRRVRPVTEKKDRLGVDGWGSTDAGVRHITRPVEETFAKEYPTFDPFPFGVIDWMSILVRSILLAEPMLDDFRACFADVSDDQTVIELAESFRLDNCVRRDRLAALLAGAARA